MGAPNVNGRLHLTGVHQKPPASVFRAMIVTTWRSGSTFIGTFTNYGGRKKVTFNRQFPSPTKKIEL